MTPTTSLSSLSYGHYTKWAPHHKTPHGPTSHDTSPHTTCPSPSLPPPLLIDSQVHMLQDSAFLSTSQFSSPFKPFQHLSLSLVGPIHSSFNAFFFFFFIFYYCLLIHFSSFLPISLFSSLLGGTLSQRTYT